MLISFYSGNKSQMHKIWIKQKKMQKEIFTFLKNIEIIYFINRYILIDYQKFLSNNLEKNDK